MAEAGACNGTFSELERAFQSSVNGTRFHEKTGWRLKHPDEVSPRQIEAMQVLTFCLRLEASFFSGHFLIRTIGSANP